MSSEPASRLRLGLLIDCDSVSAACADGVMQDLSLVGQVMVARAYGDFRLTESEAWSLACRRHGIPEVQFNRYSGGKNTGDVALVVAAMDALHNRSIDGLALVASDTDYLALISRFCADGMPVYLYGQRHTPERLKDAVTRFIHIENLLKKHPANTPGSLTKPLRSPKDFLPLLRETVVELQASEGLVPINRLHQELLAKDRHFDPRDYGYRHFVDLCASLPRIIVEHPVDAGPRVRVSGHTERMRRKRQRRRDREAALEQQARVETFKSTNPSRSINHHSPEGNQQPNSSKGDCAPRRLSDVPVDRSKS